MPVEHYFDPTQPSVEKLNAEPAPAPELDVAALKSRIAEKVREDSRERAAPTAEHVILALAPELPRERIAALLGEMAEQAGLFADIRAIVAPSGRIYLYSERHLIWNEASDRAAHEEAKHAIVDRIRADSRRIVLTSEADLEPLFPSADPPARAALLAEILADERFRDIERVAGPKGEIYLHSNVSMSANYGAIMMRAQAKDPAWAIAEFVRDRSRIMPAPTKLTVFHDPVFGVEPARLEAHVLELSADPRYADIQRLVHRRTGAVYLYSDRWLEAPSAYRLMDWEEVGQAENP